MYRIVLCMFQALIYVCAYDVKINVDQGTLLGKGMYTILEKKIYFAFYGVPYAEPPIRELRFKNPKSPKKWKNLFDARMEYHGACAQSHIVQGGLYGNEDCLHLNIYTPSVSKSIQLKTVIVWIHGHSFTSSFSHIYGPDFFIERDVIFITVTHRIGAFGFLKENQTDVHANMGLRDIVMALKWIRKNIKQFNGDKDNIALMGSGSAATLLSLLLTTKHAKLFSKLILQSGSMLSSSLFQGDHLLEKKRLTENLQSNGHKCIKTASTKAIVESSKKIYTIKELVNRQRPLIPFLPILEQKLNKSLLTNHPVEYMTNLNVASKPILIGFNTQEGISEVIPLLQNPNYLKQFSVNFKFIVPFSTGCKYMHSSNIYNEIAKEIKGRYFKEMISEKSIDDFLTYTTDLTKYSIMNFIQKYLHVNENNLFVYKFNYNGNLNAVKATSVAGVNFKVQGAASGDEICYLLRCEPIWENYVKIIRDQNKDIHFIKQITELWTNFAKFGDPTPSTYKGNVTWPPTTLKQDKVLFLSKVTHLVDNKSEMRMYAFWNNIYQKYYERCKGHDEL